MPNDPISYIDIKLLQPNPFQPRNQIQPDELDELVDSIKQFGVLESLIVAQTPVGYQIIAGERRWRAAKRAGLEKVPAMVKKTTPRGMLEMAIIENVQRVNLHPVERAKAFQQLQREFGYTNQEIAKRVGKSQAYVSNSFKLLELPDAVKDGLIEGKISEGHARALSAIPEQSAMIAAYKQLLEEGGSVRRAEELARKYKQQVGGTKKSGATGKKLSKLEQEAIATWQERLSQTLERDTKLKLSRSRQQTRLTITLKGSPEETQADLEKLINRLNPS